MISACQIDTIELLIPTRMLGKVKGWAVTRIAAQYCLVKGKRERGKGVESRMCEDFFPLPFTLSPLTVSGEIYP